MDFNQMNKRNCLFLLSLAVSLMMNLYAGVIVGKVIDKADGSALGQCTVRLLSAKDSAFVKGTSTNEKGRFRFAEVSSGSYVLQFSYVGFATVNKDVSVSDNAPKVKVGPVEMGESAVSLKETVVYGRKTEIRVKEDTVEYNADAYKLQPNAVVEDLLKRLPGVEYDKNGKITSQGKEVTKILLDGKEFFSDDPMVATKNIPVDMVNSLQVVDRKSDYSRLTGIDDGEDETVINLTIKKGMNNGIFGNVTGGYGTDDRYEANAIVNKFWNGNQFTILGGANNTNNLGFSDKHGKKFSRYGGSKGITSSQNVGINFNIGKGEEFRIGGDVMYTHNDIDNQLRVDRQYVFPDSVSYYKSNSLSRDKGHNIRGDFRMKWEVDSFNTIDFRPNFAYSTNKSVYSDTSVTIAGDPLRTIVNRSKNLGNSDGDNYEIGGSLLFNHKFRQKKGRSFSVQFRFNVSNFNEDIYSFSNNRYYLTGEEDIIDQLTDNHNWQNSVGGRLSWIEPLGDVRNGHFLEFAYNANYRWNNGDKLVYDRIETSQNAGLHVSDNLARDLVRVWGPAVMFDAELANTALGIDEVLNEDLSNRFRNNFFTQRVQLGYKFMHRNYNLNVGMQVLPSMSESQNLDNLEKAIPTRWTWNVAPYLRFKYKLGRQRTLQVKYRARPQQPSMSQLQPVADMSNPLRIKVGNPNLNPSFTNSVIIRFNDFNMKSQRSIMAFAKAQFTSNSIIQATKYNPETGGQIMTYENVNGVWNAMAMGMVSLPFKDKRWQFTNHTFVRYSVSKGYINSAFNRSGDFSFNESVGLAFRNDFIGIEASPYYGLQASSNSLEGHSTPTIHKYGGSLYVNYYLPFGFTLNSDLTYSGNHGYSANYENNQWLWDVSVSYQFLRNKAATIAVKAYDLLQQKLSISRNITANYLQDQEYNTLNRYFLVTFSYRFNSFGSGKEPVNKYKDFNGKYSRYRGGGGHRGGGGYHGGRY